MNRRSVGVRQLVSVLSVVAWAACGSVTASATAAKPADKCEADSSFVHVQAGTIQEMVARGAPVALRHVLIDGPDLDLARRVVGQPFIIRDSIVRSNLDLADTVFTDRFEISDTCIFGIVNAQLAHFNTGLDLVRSVLRNKVSLYAATINGSMTFDQTVFIDDAYFSRARIKDGAYFTRARFRRAANFIGTVVDYEGVFEGASFDGDAEFERVEFGGSARFRERPIENGVTIPAARFRGVANFKAARIGGQANFIGVIFEKEVRMSNAKFDEALFWDAKFPACDEAHNDGCEDVMFNEAEFGLVDFGGDGRTARFSPERRLNMLGFSYHATRTPLGYMLAILKRHYYREPYLYLEKLYRDKGDRDRADEVCFERRRAEGELIPAANVLRFGLDKVIRFVFGYGIRMSTPAIWIALLVGFCSLVFSRRDALEPVEHGSRQKHGIPAAPSTWKRLATSVWESVNLLVPKADLPGANRWRPRNERVVLFSRALPFSYQNLAASARVTAWVIITVSVSLFSISDFIKN